MKRFEGRVIAIAGGAGGIGTAVSQRIASEGGTVIVGDLAHASAEEVAQAIEREGGRALPLAVDIGDEESVADFVGRAVQEFGGIDGFHVNAVDSSLGPSDTDASEMAMADYDEMMRVNLRGYFLCTRHAVPQIAARGGGCMLYTGSGAAYIGMPDRPVYAMGKAAIAALMRQVASRWGKQSVRANVVSPGLTLHPNVIAVKGGGYLEEALKEIPLPRFGTPADIAAMAALLLSDDGSYVTGQVIGVDGGRLMRP